MSDDTLDAEEQIAKILNDAAKEIDRLEKEIARLPPDIGLQPRPPGFPNYRPPGTKERNSQWFRNKQKEAKDSAMESSKVVLETMSGPDQERVAEEIELWYENPVIKPEIDQITKSQERALVKLKEFKGEPTPPQSQEMSGEEILDSLLNDKPWGEPEQSGKSPEKEADTEKHPSKTAIEPDEPGE